VSKTSELPPLCVCSKHLKGTYEHRIGFMGGIVAHVVVSLVVASELVSYAVTKNLEPVPIYFGGVWIVFYGVIFTTNYYSWQSNGHDIACSRRHALLSLIFLRRYDFTTI
jgi:hypothetical protein